MRRKGYENILCIEQNYYCYEGVTIKMKLCKIIFKSIFIYGCELQTKK